jgi:hypothetical protein
MEHPFIKDLDDKSLDDLQTTISDLMKKLNFAYRTSNGPLIHQLTMALESYKGAYQKKMDELIKKQNLQTQINVTKK